MPLQGFEARVERMVDGVFSRAFRSSLKPIELGRRLVKEMDAHRTLDVQGRAIVPNVFRFSLSPADHHAFNAIEAPLVRELVDAAKEHARDEGYGFMGPLKIELNMDEALRSGRLELASEMSTQARQTSAATTAATSAPSPPVRNPDPVIVPVRAVTPAVPAVTPAVPAVMPAVPAVMPAAPVAAATPAAAADLPEERPSWASEPISWGPEPSGPQAASPAAETAAKAVLLLPTGESCDLRAGHTATIGRVPSSDLLVNDPNVSRRHAEVRPHGEGGWQLVDLGSTNGTRVNGTSASEHTLRDGDVITIGGTRIRFEVR